MTGSPVFRPFRVDVRQADLDDLALRLANARWPDAIVSDWSDGTDLGYLRELVEYWRNGFDWRAQEARLNAFPQFVVSVAGRDFHLVHVRGKGTQAVSARHIAWLARIVR
jgi:hypothetical protein